MKRVIGYTRISSKSPEQLHALEQHKARLEAAGCTEIYSDIGSRSRSDRQGLNLVLGIIQQRECDEAIFIRLDRITDSPVVLEKAITICLESGISIKGLDDAIDFNTVGGRLHARILCNLARAEVERLSERVRHGHQHHRDRNAAYFAPFGYRKVGDRLELDTEPFLCLVSTQQEMSRAAVGRDLVELFLGCNSLRRTLRAFNEKYGIYTHAAVGKGNKQPRGRLHFSVSALTSWLNNPILRGHLAYGRSYSQRQKHKALWDIRYNIHPDHRLMTEEEYRQIEEILDWNGSHGGYSFRSEIIHPLSGLVYCGECGGRCRVTNFILRTDRSIKKFSYQCSNYHLKACTQKRSVREYLIEESIVTALLARADAIAQIAQTPDRVIESPELQALKAELEFYQQAPGNRAAAIIADLQNQIDTFRLNEANISQQEAMSRELLLQGLGDRLFWMTLPDEEKQQVYRALVKRVTLQDGQIQAVTLKV